MKKLFIMKAGTSYSSIVHKYGDFDVWIEEALGGGPTPRILDIEHGAPLPSPEECAGVVISGAHSMVTENLPWSLRLEAWISMLLTRSIPLLGICYGHQLLARAAGGQVDFHPKGIEIGTVEIHLLPGCAEDVVFRHLPHCFFAHASHSQTVTVLPPGAVRLAVSGHEPNQAFRLGNCAWGVQFHPEYSTDVMRAYIEEQGGQSYMAGKSIPELLSLVKETPVAARVLREFAQLAGKQI